MNEDPGQTLDRVLKARELLKEAKAVLDPVATAQNNMVEDLGSPLERARVSAEQAHSLLEAWLDNLTVGDSHGT